MTSTVRGWLQNAGIPRRLPGRPSQAPGREELVRLYVAEGLSTTQIGQRYGVSQQTALRWLRAADVALRPQGQPTRASPPRPPSDSSYATPAVSSAAVDVAPARRQSITPGRGDPPRMGRGLLADTSAAGRPAGPGGAASSAPGQPGRRRPAGDWWQPTAGGQCGFDHAEARLAPPRDQAPPALEHPVDIETGPPWRYPPSQPLGKVNRLLKVNVPRRVG